MAFTVSQVARMSKLSVRALHHYDEIGLLHPSGRSEAGYRLYEQRDLERLQQILFYRELGFPLEEIGRILLDPKRDARAALLAQRELLKEKAQHFAALVRSVDEAISSLEKGTTMNPEKMFDGFDPSQYEEETKEKWGDTDQYKESKKRSAKYTKEDWKRYQSEAAALIEELAKLFDAKVPADSDRAKAIAESHRKQISKWFYECTPEIHRGLGEMYVADERFAANYERVRAGLTRYFRDAIVANADR
ncbi:MAG: MerR family transcriptional regulator [Myxococcaceae bacterium]